MNFSWEIYRELNPDLTKLGLTKKLEFENHYLENGKKENRAFHLYHKYPNFNPFQYKINNPDLNVMSISELENHWIFHGIKENRSYLAKKSIIDDTEQKRVKMIDAYINATYEAVREAMPPSNKCIQPIKEIKVTKTANRKKVPLDNLYPDIKKIEDSKDKIVTSKEVNSELNSLGLYNIYISNDLKHLDRICKMYNMTISNDVSSPLVLFGLYNRDDYQILNSHKSKLYIMWGGTDEIMLSQSTVKMLIKSAHIHHIAISTDIKNRLQKRGIKRVISINLDLTNYNVFKPVVTKGNKIFIYNGYNKGQEDKYGKSIYNEVINKLPEYEYIFSNELYGIPNEQMYNIYKHCFIGLRLTINDGNANMVGELKAMNIPVVHNMSDYGLKWSNADDVIQLIKKYKVTGTNLDFYNSNSISPEELDIIKENIKTFQQSIRNYKNILFISSDYPGYGGAATNCYRLQQFFGKEHNVYGIYYNFTGEPNRKIEINEQYCLVDEDKMESVLKTMSFKPNLIILKSFVNTVNVKSILECPVYYLIPGIFLNTLNKYYSNILSRDEIDTFINKSVLKQIMNSDKSFCNSNHTKLLLKKYYNINTDLFYSSFIDQYTKQIKEDLEFNKRKYKYGIVCSNFNRTIKNINRTVLALKNKKDVVLIGKDSTKFLQSNFTCIELLSNSEMLEYYKNIQYIVQDSFYESCSNVKVEALFNGCKVINSNSINSINSDNNIVKIKTETPETPEIPIKKINILDKKDIYIIDNYQKETYEDVCKTIDHLEHLGITVHYLLLSKKTELLNKYNHRIRIQDSTKIYQINNIINKWLMTNVEQIFYSNELESSMSDIISIFRDKNVLTKTIFDPILNKRLKIFINFKCSNVPYGGGNQFITNLVECLDRLSNISVTYDLEDDIDIYFILDIRKGPFKKYSFDEIYNHKKANNGFIIYRINDCSITRENCKLESTILENIDKIDHFVFNSTFIHDYYTDKYDEFKNRSISTIYNTANSNFFYPKQILLDREAYPKPILLDREAYPKPILLDREAYPKKLKIVTHHWSDNINKGYDIYYKLYQYCRERNDVELVVLGRKFADGFIEPPPIYGPYKGKELGDMLRECDIYISASKYDSCPMHILEGISCGLPILYLDHPGGVKDICELTDDKIGESFKDIEECIQKIALIKSNYKTYYENIVNNLDIYNSKQCYADYMKMFLNFNR